MALNGLPGLKNISSAHCTFRPNFAVVSSHYGR